MRSRSICLLALALTGCRAPSPPQSSAPAVVMPAAAPAASAAAPSDEPGLAEPAGLAHDSALAVSLEPARASAWIAAVLAGFGAHERQSVEQLLPLAPGVLSSPNAAQSLGIDPARPIRLGLALTAEGRAALQGLREHAAGLGSQDRVAGMTEKLDQVMLQHAGTLVQVRLAIPVVLAEVVTGHLRSLFERAQWKAHRPLAGVDSSWSDGRVVAVLRVRAGHVVVDLLLGARERAEVGSAVEGLLRTEGREQALEPLELSGHGARMVYWPAKLAELGFVDGVRRLVQVPRIALDEETQDRLFTAVLRESARNLQLAGGPGGAYFERVELTADADPLHLSMRALAELGPGLRGAAACGASVSLDFPGVDVWFDVTRTCMTSLAAPGDRFEPYVRTKFPELVAEAGWTGNLVALPFQLAAPGRATLQEAPAIRPEAMLKMERLGLLLPSVAGSEVFWGLMKTGATREQALCALDGKPGCKQRLQPGGTVQVGDAFARLVQVGSLWVVMTSNDKAALLGVSPRATDGPVAPLRAQGSRAAVAHELRSAGLSLAPSGYVAEGRLEQGRLAVSLSPQ